ncbi:MAG: flagellar filament capping protein FliD [Burkholderiales bacterium]|nr:flagellar filament capping protein FliD [Burkholderiales bacterium]
MSSSSPVSSSSASAGLISSLGIGSGLDLNGLITSLMAAEQQPLVNINTKEASFQAQLTALGTVKGALSTFQTSVQGLENVAGFNTIGATVGDASVASVTANNSAAPGSYSLQVNSLAQNQIIATQDIASTTSAIGTGSITIQFGSYTTASGTTTFNPNANTPSKTIQIPAANNTLSGIRDAINAANAGVTATIINDGTGNRLSISSTQSGTANALRITAADSNGNPVTDGTGLSQLAYDASTGGTSYASQTQAAQDANLVVNGVAITKSSNTISDAIQGVTLTLLKSQATGTAPTTISVSRDSSGIVKAAQSMVSSYNDLAKQLNTLTAYDSSTNTAGTLLGDTAVQSIQQQIRSVMNGVLNSNTYSNLSQLGITFQKDGTLALDTGVLQTAVNTNVGAVMAAFGSYGVSTNNSVQFVTSGTTTQPGKYAINITQPATQGVLTGSAVTVPTVTSSNNTFAINVNGVTSATLTIPTGTYTGTQLAAAMQSQINGDTTLKNAGSQVSVAYTNGQFVVTSSKYGSASTVQFSSGAAGFFTSFGFQSNVAGTTGLDVAGTIGGLTATGNGQNLTGTSGASGMKLLVTANTAGSYGEVDFSTGFASQLDTTLTSLLGTTGPLAAETNGINASITDLESQRTSVQQYLDNMKQNYQTQFSALDTQIAQLKQTQSYLTQQLASLPGASSSSG